MRPGELIARRFRLEAEQASGGMGSVYRALDLQTQTAVAVKFLQLSSGQDAERFAREASLLAQVSHPGIVRYVAHGATGDGQFLAMEWIDGETLKDRLAREGLTTIESVDLAKQVARALGEMHARGIIHRDIKPTNLMFVHRHPGRVKILDFGIARRSDDRLGLTRTGFMVGSPGYMAPEQARGDRSPLDHHADLFALGCVLYECLTGRPPFFGDPVAVRAKVLLSDPPAVQELNPDVSVELGVLVGQLLSKEPGHRPVHAEEVAEQLERLRERPGPPRKHEAVDAHSAATASIRPPRGATPTANTDSGQMKFLLSIGADLDGSPMPEGRIAETIGAYGGKLETVDGAWRMALFSTGLDEPSAVAVAAAHCALALRALVPHAPMTLICGAATEGLGALIDRAVSQLTSDSVAGLFSQTVETSVPDEGIRLDEGATRLLQSRFDVMHTPAGMYLRGLEGPAEPQA